MISYMMYLPVSHSIPVAIILRSAFCVLRSAFCVLRSAFCVLRSAFCVLRKIPLPIGQPRPQGLLLVQNGGRRNPWPRLPKWLQKFVRISSHKHDQMSSFCLNNDFRLQKTNRAARRWKQPPKKPFDYVSRDKILHDSWSISAALARGSPTAILNEEKALGTRLADRELQH